MTIADTLALAIAGVRKTASSCAASQARRSAGSRGGLGSSAEAPGRGARPIRGRGPFFPVVAASVSVAGGGCGFGAGAAAGSGSFVFAAALGPTAKARTPRQNSDRRVGAGRNAATLTSGTGQF